MTSETTDYDYLESLKPIRIHFETKKDRIEGFYTLMTSGKPVHGLQNGQYIISNSQLTLLNGKNIKYKIDTK
jgi:hypothetical protein